MPVRWWHTRSARPTAAQPVRSLRVAAGLRTKVLLQLKAGVADVSTALQDAYPMLENAATDVVFDCLIEDAMFSSEGEAVPG